MVRGFYTLGSGMLTQSRILTGISNNLANVETLGYKRTSICHYVWQYGYQSGRFPKNTDWQFKHDHFS